MSDETTARAGDQAPPAYRVLDIERHEGGVAVVAFNRPDKFNAANAEIFQQLAAAVRELDRDPEVGCVILTGKTFTHPKKGTPVPVFSAGADVAQFAGIGKTEAGYAFIELCFEPFKALELAKTPVIAAINGAAFGFGFEIAGACDMAFAAASARLGLKEINHGALPAWAVTRGLEKLGKQVVAYLCLTGKEVSAQEARRLGIVLDVLPDDELLAHCQEVAGCIAANPPMAKAFIKSILNRGAIEGYSEAERFMPAIFATDYMQGAFARFLSGESKHKE